MQEETGATPDEVTRAFILVRDIYGFDALWGAIDALDNRVDAAVQSEMFIETGRLVVRATLWFLRRRRETLPIAEVLAIFQPGLEAFRRQLPAVLSTADRETFEAAAARLAAKGVPQELAREMAGLDALYAVLDATEVAARDGAAAGSRGAALLRAGGRPRAALVRRAHHGAAHRHDVAGARAQRPSRRPRQPAAHPHDRRGEARPGRAPSRQR